jgi:hypothetical protein
LPVYFLGEDENGCGMHFQAASHRYHCIQCDTLTNFSDLSRDDIDEHDD